MSAIRTFIGAVAGIALLVFGLMSLSETEVKCGDEVMAPGDVCTTISNGDSTDRSYEQQRSENRRTALLMTGGGALLTVVGGGFLVAGIRKRRKAKAEQVATPPEQQPAAAPSAPPHTGP